MNTYVTITEIKSFLSISGTSQDTLLAMLNKMATADINEILSVSDLALHKVEGERLSTVAHGPDCMKLWIDFNDPQVVAVERIMDDDVEYTQDEAYDIRDYRVYLEDFLAGGHRLVTVDYAAGWHAAGWTTLEVTDYSAIVGGTTITLTPDGDDGDDVILTEGADWDASVDNNTTAANIAEAINNSTNLGKSAVGIRAVCVNAVIYLADNVPQRDYSTVALSSSTGFDLGNTVLDGAINFPESIREAVILMVAGRLAKRKSTGVKSYTIGSKSVQFGDDGSGSNDANTVKKTLARYMRAKVRTI